VPDPPPPAGGAPGPSRGAPPAHRSVSFQPMGLMDVLPEESSALSW
jgi:hypothetical protein